VNCRNTTVDLAPVPPDGLASGAMEITGLPLHPLVIHAAVVFTPLAAALAVAFAVVPRWRYLLRWPLAVTTVAALGSVWLSRISGESLVDSRPELRQLIETHEQRGQTLSLLMIAFTVVVAVAVWGLGGASGLLSGAGARETRVAVLDKVLPALLIVGAVLVLAWVGLTGDAGSRVVWG
jgi:hypothetical protein